MTTLSMRIGALLFAVIVAITVPATAQGPAKIGTVVQQRGSVTVLRGTVPALLRIGAPVYLGDRVVTGAQSRIRIEMSDQSVLAIGADSDVALSEQVLDGDGNPLSTLVSVVYGIVRATVRRLGPSRTFDIETQTAIASARSTQWSVESSADRTAVFVVEGVVEVAGRTDGAVLLTPGFGTDVISNAAPTPPAAWSAQRRDATLARTEFR